MANPLKGETLLTLADGRAFTLMCDMEALIGVEALTGKPMHVVIAQAGEGFWGAVAAIAQTAFLRFHPEIRREDVLAMLRTDRAALEAALTEAMRHAFPEASANRAPDEDDEGVVGNAPSQPRGKSSGRSGAKPGSTRKASGGQHRAASS